MSLSKEEKLVYLQSTFEWRMQFMKTLIYLNVGEIFLVITALNMQDFNIPIYEKQFGFTITILFDMLSIIFTLFSSRLYSHASILFYNMRIRQGKKISKYANTMNIMSLSFFSLSTLYLILVRDGTTSFL